VAARRHFGGLGIDVEPAETIEGSLVPRIADGRELEMFECEPYGAKMLFSIKEAVFKAVHPQDGVMLDFPDIRIDRKSQTARTAYGRVVEWRVVSTPRVVATAWWL
jgi:4'-phosphopantetheinyl transferase EntD